MGNKITYCVTCNISIHYATKKPKWCTKCKQQQPKTYRTGKKKRPPTQSKKEVQMKQILNTVFPKDVSIDNGYYSFLMSPKGAPLQLDRYYPDLKLAFEFDGAQHKSYNPYMHKTKAAFEYLQQCDRMKNEYCKALGIHLVRISHEKKITKAYIVERLEAEGILSNLRQQTYINEALD